MNVTSIRGRLAAAAVVAAAMVLTLASSQGAPKPKTGDLKTGSITVTATPIQSFSRFGSDATGASKLVFRGGLVLQSDHKNFGGWSGIVLDRDAKKFLAISDAGAWMSGAITYSDGKPSGLEGVRIGPLLGQDGSVLTRNRYRDAEGLTLESGSLDDGTVLVSFERKARIVRFKIGPKGLGRPDGSLELPKSYRSMHRNQGFEAIGVMKGGPLKGRSIAFAERLYDAARDHTGWVWTADGVKTIHIKNIGDFDITDIASDERGALYVLERRFRWTEGVKMRLRRIAAEAIVGELTSGQTVEGETLIEADMSSQIDNMEGLALARTDAGELLITIISDDNMNRTLQRNLLLQFVLKDGEQQKARLQR